jgi:hypothetical protein
MKRALLAAVAASVTLAGLSLQAADTGQATPQRVDDFQLTAHNLTAERLYYYGYAPAIVVMSQANGTAVSRQAAAGLEKLAAGYRPKGVVFFRLDSKLSDSRDAVAAEEKKQGFTIPVLMDEQQLVGEQLHVSREAEVFVIDPKTWTVAYRGPLDADAAKAIDGLAAGHPAPALTKTVAAGEAIAFPAHKAEFAKISYAKEVAPILQAKCASCHLKGGIGPFAMDSYQVIKGFSPMIRETVRTQRMPPYFADPHIGTFKNDQGLTAAERKTLVHWIEAGSPRGEGPDPLLANAG